MHISRAEAELEAEAARLREDIRLAEEAYSAKWGNVAWSTAVSGDDNVKVLRERLKIVEMRIVRRQRPLAI